MAEGATSEMCLSHGPRQGPHPLISTCPGRGKFSPKQAQLIFRSLALGREGHLSELLEALRVLRNEKEIIHINRTFWELISPMALFFSYS